MTPEQYQRVKQIFQAVIDEDAQSRADLIAESCAGDEVLRREVESLLGYRKQAEGFIEQSAFAVGAHLITREGVDSLNGRRIGQYKLIEEVGHGGMGVVYKAARDDDQYQQEVAIKIVRLGLHTKEIQRRFSYERQILANLDHPNIARLLDAGTTDEGLPYLVMDYVVGVSIDKFCSSNQVSLNATLNIFREVCSAVQYAHQRLVIHRDIKPGNILVTEAGVPKLLDFGIAKLLDPGLSEVLGTTATDFRVLTPQYSSPEQIRGEDITTTSDVYSLGVLLYEITTGQSPYRTTSNRPDKIAHAICEQKPERPSTITSRSDTRSLRGDLDNIILKALQKDPARRYASVEQLADDIRRHQEGLPVIARADSLRYRATKLVQRNKLPVGAALLILLSLISGIIASTWQMKVAAAERDRARTEKKKAEELNQFLQQMLASADPAENGKDVTVAKLLAEAAQRLDTEFPNQPETAAAMRSTIGMTYMSLGMYDAAETQLRSALETRKRLFGVDNAEVAASMNNLAQVLVEQGRIPEAEQLYRDALEISRRHSGAEDLKTATIMHNLAALLTLKGSLDEAEQMNRAELAIRRRLLGPNNDEVARSLNDLGVVVGTKGNLAEAEQLHREALAIARQVYGPEHVNVAATMATVAAIVEEQGDYVEAEKLYLEALAMRRKLLGPEHPTVSWTLYNYAYMLTRKGDYQSAATLAREVLALRGKTLTDEHPMVASSLQVLGRSLMELGDLPGAEKVFRESLELRRKSLPADHWLIGTSESILGGCLVRMHRLHEAEILLKEGYAKVKAKFGEDHARTREARERLNSLQVVS